MSTGEQVVERGRPALRLLGDFQLLVGEQSVELPSYAQRVLGFLAVQGSSARREALAGNLWPWTTQARAHASLRTALWRIRQAHPALVVASHDTVRLHEELEVDVHVTIQRARELFEADAHADAASVPLQLFQSDLLPYWDDDWVLLERERVRQLRIHALESLARRSIAGGHFVAAIEAAYAAIAAEPLRESARRVLIEAHLAEGNPTEALVQLIGYRRLLEEECSLAPSKELEALVEVATSS